MKKKMKQRAATEWVLLESTLGGDMWREARYRREAALHYYIKQSEPNSCGLATMCIVLNDLHDSRLFEEYTVLVTPQS